MTSMGPTGRHYQSGIRFADMTAGVVVCCIRCASHSCCPAAGCNWWPAVHGSVNATESAYYSGCASVACRCLGHACIHQLHKPTGLLSAWTCGWGTIGAVLSTLHAPPPTLQHCLLSSESPLAPCSTPCCQVRSLHAIVGCQVRSLLPGQVPAARSGPCMPLWAGRSGPCCQVRSLHAIVGWQCSGYLAACAVMVHGNCMPSCQHQPLLCPCMCCQQLLHRQPPYSQCVVCEGKMCRIHMPLMQRIASNTPPLSCSSCFTHDFF